MFRKPDIRQVTVLIIIYICVKSSEGETNFWKVFGQAGSRSGFSLGSNYYGRNLRRGMNLMIVTKDPQEGKKQRLRREGIQWAKTGKGWGTAAVTMNSPCPVSLW